MESSASEPLVPLQSLPLVDSRPFFRGSAAPSASLLLVARPLCFPLGGVREKVECASTWGWHQTCAQAIGFQCLCSEVRRFCPALISPGSHLDRGKLPAFGLCT